MHCAVPNPSYAQSGKRVCVTKNGKFAMKINKGSVTKRSCNIFVGNRNLSNNKKVNLGPGNYMTCEAFKKNFLNPRVIVDYCRSMKTLERTKPSGTTTKGYYPQNNQVHRIVFNALAPL